MADLGFDGHELFKKSRFRPATFWKTNTCQLVAPAVHKDRTLLTAFRVVGGDEEGDNDKDDEAVPPDHHHPHWYVLNCHLQAGKQAPRRVRQIHEGVRSVLTLARKLKGVCVLCAAGRALMNVCAIRLCTSSLSSNVESKTLCTTFQSNRKGTGKYSTHCLW